MQIRDATTDDLPGIFAIYDEQVLHGTATFDTVPKTLPERIEWFNANPGGRYPILVAQENGEIAGWARLYQWSPRRAYDRTAENAVYVRADCRGQGTGRLLLQALLERAPQIGIAVVIARIVEGNPGSLRLHQTLGFQNIGVMSRVGEKFGRLLNVRLMERQLDMS